MGEVATTVSEVVVDVTSEDVGAAEEEDEGSASLWSPSSELSPPELARVSQYFLPSTGMLTVVVFCQLGSTRARKGKTTEERHTGDGTTAGLLYAVVRLEGGDATLVLTDASVVCLGAVPVLEYRCRGALDGALWDEGWWVLRALGRNADGEGRE